jgi:hypothetical protein
MTLLELISALVVGGLAVTIGFGVLRSRQEFGARIVAFYDGAVTDDQIRATLHLWLATAYMRPDRSSEFRGVDGKHEGMDDAEVALETTSARLGQSVAIRLMIDRDPKTRERGLVVELIDSGAYTPERIELAAAAVGLRIRYLSGLPSDTTWFPSWISKTVLPRGIEIVVQAAHPDSLPLSLRRPIRMPIGVVW